MTDRVPCKGNVLGSFVPARYILAILGSIAMAIVYGLKVNLSVAMVAMLNHTALKAASDSHHSTPKLDTTTILPLVNITNATANVIADLATNILPNVTADLTSIAASLAQKQIAAPEDACSSASESSAAVEDGPFTWSEPLQGTILSCYFWGYFVSQIPGARIAENFSAKYVMLFSVAINVVCTILTPLAANIHYLAMIAMRIGEGIGGGVTFPAMHVMLAAWAPPTERSTMSALVYAGTSLGTVISMFLAGILAGSFGWESVFYVMGFAASIWIVLWLWLIQDTPSKQPLISQEERNLINSSLGSSDKPDHAGEVKSPVPWRRVFTSLPFLAILVAHTCSNWGWYMLLIELPFYMKQVLKFNIKENAVVTAVPFLTMWLFSMALSKILDTLRSRRIISTTLARKIATLFASAVPMVCLFSLCYIGCQRGLAVFLMGIGITSIGGMFCGFLSNHIDIAPNYAGTLMAITNTSATLPGIIVPIFVGSITHGNQTIGAWRVIFFVTIVLYIIEIIAYTLFGSGEEQPWNKSQARELISVASTRVHNSETAPLKTRDNRNTYEANE